MDEADKVVVTLAVAMAVIAAQGGVSLGSAAGTGAATATAAAATGRQHGHGRRTALLAVPKCSAAGLTAAAHDAGVGAGAMQLERLLQGGPAFWFDLALYCIDDAMRDTALRQLQVASMVDSSSTMMTTMTTTGAHSRAHERAHGEAQERATDRAVDRAALRRHMGEAVFWRCHDPHQELTPLLEVMAAAGRGAAPSQEWSVVLVEGVLLGLGRVSDWGGSDSGSGSGSGGGSRSGGGGGGAGEPALANDTMYDRAGLVCEALAALVGRHMDHAVAGDGARVDPSASAAPAVSASTTTRGWSSLRTCQYWFVTAATPVLEAPSRRPLIPIFLRQLTAGVLSTACPND